MQLNLSYEEQLMLSEALTQYVENNENALLWFGTELNPKGLPARNALAEAVLEQVNINIAIPKEQAA
jgi:hypothetical protein